MEKNRLIAIVGPTASGKTGLAIEIAKRIDGEIVSCDSMQIYRDIPIASAVATAEEKAEVPHHLIEFLEPDSSFSVAEYVEAAKRCIEDILSRGKTPILCGGTGLYYSSLVDNISFEDQPGQTEIRERLENELNDTSAEFMHKKLKEIDPAAAEKLAVSDTRRVIRAIELFELTGLSAERRNELSKSNPSPYNTVTIGIDYKNRQLLYSRIEKRIDIMIENGLIAEAEARFKKSGGAAQAIGHKEFFPYFAGEISLEQAIDNLKTSTRRYAKRQLTWFRRDERINWIFADENEDVVSAAMDILK